MKILNPDEREREADWMPFSFILLTHFSFVATAKRRKAKITFRRCCRPRTYCACNNTIENAKLFISGDFDWRTLSIRLTAHALKIIKFQIILQLNQFVMAKEMERKAGKSEERYAQKKANTPKRPVLPSEDKETNKKNAECRLQMMWIEMACTVW